MIESQSILRYFIQGIVVVVVAVLLSACSTSNTIKNVHLKARIVDMENPLSLQPSQDKFEKIIHNLNIKSRIMNQYSNWKGVRYRLGGSTKKGIDCSGFVQRTFREQFGLVLPRSTYKQQEIGKSISRSKLRIGDLVLFHVGSTGRHVGIYIGNDQFVHVSSSNGVTISSMNEPYWKKRFDKARRVLIPQLICCSVSYSL